MSLSSVGAAPLWSLFERAIAENIDPHYPEPCRIQRLAEPSAGQRGTPRRLVSVGISSYLFRIAALFDFGADPATLAHLCLQARTQDLSGQLLTDAYAEQSNMICGSVNRTLSRTFRHVGMSTPAFLDERCADHLSLLKPDQLAGFQVQTVNGMSFHVALCLSSAANQPLAFSLEGQEEEDCSSGEIDFF
jgi:hypothetical protein